MWHTGGSARLPDAYGHPTNLSLAKYNAFEQKIFACAKPERFKNDFDLIRQMNRAAGSVMDNIAEGFGRGSRLEFISSLSIAKGEATELESQLIRARNRGYLSEEGYTALKSEAEKLSAKLGGFIKYLNSCDHKGQKFRNRTNP